MFFVISILLFNGVPQDWLAAWYRQAMYAPADEHPTPAQRPVHRTRAPVPLPTSCQRLAGSVDHVAHRQANTWRHFRARLFRLLTTMLTALVRYTHPDNGGLRRDCWPMWEAEEEEGSWEPASWRTPTSRFTLVLYCDLTIGTYFL